MDSMTVRAIKLLMEGDIHSKIFLFLAFLSLYFCVMFSSKRVPFLIFASMINTSMFICYLNMLIVYGWCIIIRFE